MKTAIASFGFAVAALAIQQVEATELARADMMDTEGGSVGVIEIRQTQHGALLHAKLENLPPGAHAFHVHAVGDCTPPFTSAGGHYNPGGKKHGFDAADGMHAGDMPNIHVPESGRLEIEVLNVLLTLDEMLFDDDGASIVIHEGPDDYVSDPSGEAGARIACGVITN